MVIELIKGVALLLALSLLESINSRFWEGRKVAAAISSGVLFGGICVIGMMTPVVLAPGVIFDARSVVLSMAGLFGGPLAAGVATAIAGGYRLWLGGAGVGVGVAVVVACAALGLLYRHAIGKGWVKLGVWELLAFGLLVHLVVITIFTQLPAEVAARVLSNVSFPLVLTFTPATLFLGLLLQDGVNRRKVGMALRESEARFRSLLQDIPGVSVQGYAPDGTTRYWNKASERLYGYSAEEALGRNLRELIIPPDMREGVREAMHQMFETGQAIPASELVLQRKDGSSVPVFSSHAYVEQPGREPEMFCIDIDLTERARADAELRIAATAFEAQEGIIVTDPRQVILRVNKSFTDSVGYTEAEAVGQTLALFNSGRHDDAFYANMNRHLEQHGQWAGEIWSRRKNGEVFPEWINIMAVLDDRQEVSHYVATLTDITQRKAAEEQIKQLAFFDPLTSLPNRRLLMDRLEHALAVSERNKRSGALLFIDLDHFKTLNDTQGHDKGDQLLQQVAKRLTGCVRDGDTVARLGGDEFLVMLEDLDQVPEVAAAEARLVGEKIVELLNRPYRLGELDFHSTPSVGVALYYDHSVSIEELLKQADLAMYQTKSAGRNGMRFFDPAMQAVVNSRARLEADLRQGILLEQFVLYYQPQVDRHGRVTGVEALLRWPHPERGMVSPLEFIPLAEETGHILQLGNWVLETACAQLVAWAKHPVRSELTIAVNVSARQFREKDFAAYVLGLIEYTGANPQNLKLELTESMLADNLEDIVDKMSALRERGIGFSLDDFGTGYSSLSYLKRLPLDQLKIDQSFVRDVLTDPNDAAIAQTIVALAQSLGLAVIAEGVETEAQRGFLADHGCHAYQGYLFSRPLPVKDLEQFVEAVPSQAQLNT
ncbi:EAL domain-containing protein [Rhodoferax sp.]|uniref:EAL domain-containing protein n=1 Tax=Rhodoferax sp. TaxID=50421 RepID=UPI001ED66E0D|nr:EAL domain-containing protein [Rhodoferax sp.]MBT9506909.1 EAL domain-containing protein [Rhodoferax sp.]